jgi:hypothetical protein
MQQLVEDFLVYLRHERGQAAHTQRTYAALLGRFVAWAESQDLEDWPAVQLSHLMSFLDHERRRPREDRPQGSSGKLSGETLYLEIAAFTRSRVDRLEFWPFLFAPIASTRACQPSQPFLCRFA